MHLTISNVSKTYSNGTRALRDVSLEIPSGLYGLLGPNGAGKSTLMRTLATLQAPDTGTVRLADADRSIDVLTEKTRLRRHLGYLPQSFGLYPDATAERLLHHFATLKGIADRADRRARVDALFERTNLEDARSQTLDSYSGGMKQRFGIAVALLGDPRLIIVDEPTAGLDPAERTRFLNLLSELGEDSVVILSTHIVKDVRELCSKMAIIRSGRIVFEGNPIQAVGELDGRIWRKTVPREQLAAVEREHVVLSSKLVAGRPVLRIYADAKPGEHFDPVAPELEDVYFLQMMRAERPASGAPSDETASETTASESGGDVSDAPPSAAA